MLARGVYLPPSQFEALFISLAHSDADLDTTIAAAYEALASSARPKVKMRDPYSDDGPDEDRPRPGRRLALVYGALWRSALSSFHQL